MIPWKRIADRILLHLELYVLIATVLGSLATFYSGYKLVEYRIEQAEDELKSVKGEVVTREVFDLQVNNLKESLSDIKGMLRVRYTARDVDQNKDGPREEVSRGLCGLR